VINVPMPFFSKAIHPPNTAHVSGGISFGDLHKSSLISKDEVLSPFMFFFFLNVWSLIPLFSFYLLFVQQKDKRKDKDQQGGTILGASPWIVLQFILLHLSGKQKRVISSYRRRAKVACTTVWVLGISQPSLYHEPVVCFFDTSHAATHPSRWRSLPSRGASW